MNTLTIIDIPVAVDLEHEQMTEIQGGMKKLPFQTNSIGPVTADGDPVDVYVDGVLVNSVRDGFAH